MRREVLMRDSSAVGAEFLKVHSAVPEVSSQVETTRRSGHGSGLLGGGLVAAAGILAALALVFSSATGVADVAADARVQQRAEAALGVTASARYALGQVLLLHEIDASDTVAADLIREDVDAAVAAVEARLGDLTEALGGASDEVDAAWEEVSAAAAEYLALVDAQRIPDAAEAAAGRLAPALDALTDVVSSERNARAQAIATAESEVGRVATAARFLVALGIPMLGIGAFVLVLRRRQRGLALSLALEHERRLSRSKDQLIANLSHELRTPLTSIYGAALTLEEAGFEDPELAAELNGMVVEQARDLSRMVDDLLVSAQAQADRLSFEIVPTQVVAEVDTVVAEFRRAGRAVVVDVADLWVSADPLRLRQILRNLISNAIRHGGDRIAVVGVPAGEASYRLAVVDDGPGVPSDLEEQLFDPFVHAGKRALVTGSVGLGLSITKVLADGMDAGVSYVRRSDMTHFVVRLPVSEGPGASGGEPEAAVEAMST
jgi:signal transduction histidine kinase